MNTKHFGILHQIKYDWKMKLDHNVSVTNKTSQVRLILQKSATVCKIFL